MVRYWLPTMGSHGQRRLEGHHLLLLLGDVEGVGIVRNECPGCHGALLDDLAPN